MATLLADFPEQNHPKTLARTRRAGFQQATRVHRSFLAAAEKRALVWMAERMPGWVNSDRLTALGFAAQIATGICYSLAGRDRRMLLAAIVCLAVNWFGDSLDGTLARVRHRQRPRYGFYVDHMIDSVGAVATVLNLPPGATTTTIESKTNFVAAIRAGEAARAECSPVHIGRTTMVWQTRIVRPNGKLCAIVTQTQMILPARAAV